MAARGISESMTSAAFEDQSAAKGEAAVPNVRNGRGSIHWWIGLLALAAIVFVGALELFAWLLPQRLDNVGGVYVWCASLSFFVRVFQLHIAAVVALLAAVLFVCRRRRFALGTLLFAMLLLAPFARDYLPKHPPAPASSTLRVMSMNLYYRNRDEAAIVRAIEAANPDVIVLVEVTPWSLENVIQKHLLSKYEYVNQPRFDGVGTVLSRVPYRIGDPAENEGGSFGRSPVLFDVGGREIALYAVHLVSPGHTWLIRQNRQQVLHLSEIVRAEKRPAIIAGDCNFSQLTPNAAALHDVGMRSAHELIGFGLGNTWGPRWYPSINWLPGVRIDHIWLSKELTATRSEVGLDTGSDHRPVIADIAVAKSP